MRDRDILNVYANEIYGCDVEDLSDKELIMLKNYVRQHNDEFEYHRGLQ